MQYQIGRLGGQLGVLLCLIGLGLIFFGWNGAASHNFVPAQFPYLISGGLSGLAVVVIGAAMLVVQNQRADRARLEVALERLAATVEHQRSANPGVGGSGLILAGATSYHRLDCTLPEAREEARLVPVEEALARHLEPCRICRPPS